MTCHLMITVVKKIEVDVYMDAYAVRESKRIGYDDKVTWEEISSQTMKLSEQIVDLAANRTSTAKRIM